MVNLSTALDYVWLFLISGGLGAVGGIGFELLQTRVGNLTGALTLPRWSRNSPFVDLGFLSSMFLGAVAAVAVSYFFTPEVQAKVNVHGAQVIQTEWAIARVVPLSLIVGSAGGAFLRAMQARVQLAVTAQRVAATRTAGKTALAQLAQASQNASSAALTQVMAALESDAMGEVHSAAYDLPPHALSFLTAAVRTAEERPPYDLLAQLDRAPVPPETRVNNLRERLQQHAQAAVDQTNQAIADQLGNAQAAVDAAADT